ncbi:venom serine carboxypeptidase-like [Achroia grisella]|uniref:venom serine carboxypeptidase-like n=1 Tax=Achroia grisella TaxID=688607 RepID=UPI0027D28ABE|nr:venom serine carboxypeptidase-like [Achroia grisella]
MDIFGATFFLWFSVAVNTVIVIAAESPALILTPYIKRNETEKARNLSEVDKSLFLNVSSYSGFVTVDERYNSNMFFWYFPVAEGNVTESPWIIWLQGGPGATSLAGVFDEIGPFEYNKELKLRDASWGKGNSLLFIDNPVGTGFSFTNSDDGFIRDMNKCAEDLYSLLQQFLTVFPELRKAPLYIAGESYAGRYAPAFAYKILQTNNLQRDEPVNLQGLMLGNPVFNHKDIADYTKVYYEWGLIDSNGVQIVKPLQDAYLKAITDNNYKLASSLREQLLNELENITLQKQSYNILKDAINVDQFISFVDRNEIKQAIHVGAIKFAFSNETVFEKLISDFLSNNTLEMETLLENYRILIYCGQLDAVAPCVLNAEGRRRSWAWSQRDKFMNAPRTPVLYNDSVAGYVKSGGGLTEVLVRGAGHLVPIDKPEQTQKLISYFVRNFNLPIPQNYNVYNSTSTKLQSGEVISNVSDIKTNETVTYGNAALIVSVIINAILMLIIAGGVIYILRFKRRSTSYFYEVVDDNSSISDGVLTMT